MRVTRIIEVYGFCIMIVFSSLVRASKYPHHGPFLRLALLFLYRVLVLASVKLVGIY